MPVNPNNSEKTITIIERIENNITELYTMLDSYILLYDETVKPSLNEVNALKQQIKERLDRIL